MSSGVLPAVELADSSNKNQQQTQRLWNAAHESGFRFGEFVLLDKVLPRILSESIANAISFGEIFEPMEWFDKAVQVIHYHSEELTNKFVDYQFMKAALKVAGFELATDTTDSYYPFGWKEGEGDVHFLRGQIFGFSFTHSAEHMANRSFKKPLLANELIPKYTQTALRSDHWMDANLGEVDSYDGLFPNNVEEIGFGGGLDCLVAWQDDRRDFDWIVEFYLSERIGNKRRVD